MTIRDEIDALPPHPGTEVPEIEFVYAAHDWAVAHLALAERLLRELVDEAHRLNIHWQETDDANLYLAKREAE